MSAHKNRHIFSILLSHNSRVGYGNKMKFTSQHADIHGESQNVNMLSRTGDIAEYLTRCNMHGHG